MRSVSYVEYANSEDANNKAANDTVAATKLVAGTSILASGDWKVVSTNNNTVVQVHTEVKGFTEINNVGTLSIGLKNNNSVIGENKDPTQTIFIMERKQENALDANSHSTSYHDTIDGMPTGYANGNRITNQAVESLDDGAKTDIVVESAAQSTTL